MVNKVNTPEQDRLNAELRSRRQRPAASQSQQPGNQPAESTAYRGYLIRYNPLNSMIWIERDRHLVAHAADVAAARATIDGLIDWAPSDPAMMPEKGDC